MVVVPKNKTAMVDWILLTGPPGCGKTTAVRKLAQYILQQQEQVGELQCRGFYTEEVRQYEQQANVYGGSYGSGGRGGNSRRRSARIGFDIVTITNDKNKSDNSRNKNRAILARADGLPDSFPRTGKYRVHVAAFESLALKSLSIDANGSEDEKNDNDGNGKDEKQFLILDEIGKMELHSEAFQKHVELLLKQRKKVRLVGAITSPGRVHFCDYVIKQPGVQVFELSQSNRDQMVEDLKQLMKESWF